MINNKDDNIDVRLVKMFDDDRNDEINKQVEGYRNYYSGQYQSPMLSKRRFMLRGVRLPSESVLLGKRRLLPETVPFGQHNTLNKNVDLSNKH